MATAIEKYLERRNAWNRMTNQPLATVPTTAAQCEQWFESLECDFSPENICADGERSRAEVRKLHTFYTKVWKELEQIAGVRENSTIK